MYKFLTDKQLRDCLNPPPYLEELRTKTNPPKIYIPPVEFQNKRPNLPVEIWEKIFKILHRMCLAESLEILTTIKKYASRAGQDGAEAKVPFKFWKYQALQENYEHHIHYNLNEKYKNEYDYVCLPHRLGKGIWNSQYNSREFGDWTDDEENHNRAIANKWKDSVYPRMWYVGHQDGMLRYGLHSTLRCVEDNRKFRRGMSLPHPFLFKAREELKKDLVEMCRMNKLKVSGNKKVLVKRLMSI
tara:strand:+ start:58 stop:786 length:729 start_codon:yes stop_codon:yes gene_type:complete